MSKNVSALSFRKGIEKNLFERLSDSAKETGTVTSENLKAISEEYLLGDATILGAVSFYDFLKNENAGKQVFVCNGTACMTAGTQDKLRGTLKEHFRDEEIGEICCLGRCYENGSFQYGGVNYSAKSDEEISGIFKNREGASPGHYATSSNLAPPILIAKTGVVEKYYRLLGDLLAREPTELIEEIKASKIRGRGGAGFPTGIKWESCREAKGSPKYITCNADEGDPGAYIDRYLMEERPHSVLFGMIVAGYIVGSEIGVLYIRAEYPDSIDVIERSIRELYNYGLLGNDILGSGFSFRLKTIKGAGAYICGEETAMLASIEGRRPEVGVRPPYPTEEGLFGRPTIVNNVETFSCMHRLFEMGGKEFSSIGTEASTGPKLVSLDGWFHRPGVYEVEMGTPLSEVVDGMGGGFRAPVKALQIGGPLGGIVPVARIADLNLDFESFKENGFLLGHGSIVCIPEAFSILKYIEHLFEFTAAESCGKCFPCRLGSVRGQELAEKARVSDYKIDPELLNDLLNVMEMTSLCALGGGVPLPIRNALHYFEEELRPYLRNKDVKS